MLRASCSLVMIPFAMAASQGDINPKGVVFENQTWVEEQLKVNAKLMADWKQNGESNGGCTLSGVMQMPVCFQICDEWCWATTTSMTVDYYKGASQCQGLECQMPSREFGLQCCPYTNSCKNSPSDPQSSCNKGGTAAQMADAAGALAGGQFSQYGPLDQSTLDYALNSGRPVMIGVLWNGGGGGHALIIGGCGNGRYYLHDPWGWYQNMPSNWQSLSFDQLLQYTAPNGGVGKWTFTVTWNLGDDEGHQKALQRIAAKNSSAVIV